MTKLIGRYDPINRVWNYGYWVNTKFIIVFSMPVSHMLVAS